MESLVLDCEIRLIDKLKILGDFTCEVESLIYLDLHTRFPVCPKILKRLDFF